ncbi:hypothetical protein [Duncaniella muris]|uniref:hypothetical protein n=1 Tax=Duncaniella muris TaxID=2094150 RepID=UPI000F46BBEB|nr:hypothetical protein [Duncaniella muris]ROS96877.1 hypothetical protein EEL40_08020 [Muribaculaceae bacterium Isolate-083 (Janvier)]ROS98058.1 hypothetical protein EEL37_05255 [Muribaculaceae bacterium Isolate-077 (Janvier)]ROT01289.1 hypothetical protein EEL41_05750 [Muribaculaceae bacterium Isolate-084 (Janvier)]GFI52713.1 hypothetical protein IMSAGC021_01019 [Muribaculaceae bacterium]
MRRILQTLSIALLAIILSIPCIEAQSRSRENREGRGNRTERTSSPRGNHKNNSNNNRGGHSSSHNTRPNSSRPSNRRPDIIPARDNTNHRPDNNGRPNVGNGNNNHHPDNNGHRPGVGNGNNHRPGNNGHRPGIGNGNNNRPGNNGHRPGIGNGNNHRPGNNGHRPGIGHHPAPRPPHVAPPHRPYRPVMARPHHRPMPPRGWRPAGRIPVIRGILGLTFGSAINISLDYLLSSGYNVDGYTNDIVYLRNVSAMNYVWTDGALYYGTHGLDASSFYYSTPRYDLARYNNVYNSLVATYGMPVSVSNTPGSIGATWFGGNNGYITLSFGSNTMNGRLRYLTTLTYGL